MTFMVLFLADLLDPETITCEERCIVHPKKKRLMAQNEVIDYGAAMNILLAYHNLMDDWRDEGKTAARTAAARLKKFIPAIEEKYPCQAKAVRDSIAQLGLEEQNPPKDLDAAFVKNLDNFDLLCCRESLSYDALVEAGLGAKARLVPDPAFTLETIEKPLPEGFLPNNTVGVNVSPMIISNEGEGGVTMANYVALIQHILDTTDMAVALIPHVVWSYNDDREPLRRLYEQFKDSGRVVLIEDADCRVLKGYISRLRFFVGARTHSTIAAYSTCVPTLVVGYSVKAKGIAHDLFGSYEPYVLPVQELREPGDLAAAFARLMVLEDDMRCCLQASMPAYIESAYAAGDELRRLLESK